MRGLNAVISSQKLEGNKAWFTWMDLSVVWKEAEGRCFRCGIQTNLIKPKSKNSTKFTLRVPIRMGGEASRQNLTIVCAECKKKAHPSVHPPALKVIGYNAFSDSVVQLVNAVISKEAEAIRFFQREVDRILGEIVENSHYKIVDLERKKLSHVPAKAVSTAVKEIAESIVSEMKIASLNRSYTPKRED